MTYLLYNGFASYFIKLSLTKKVGVAKASLNRAKNKFNEIGPETEWSIQEQFEFLLKLKRRNEPVAVAKSWDDFWLAEKFQSNSEIAGFLRKLFR
jgi:hypothetical protein